MDCSKCAQCCKKLAFNIFPQDRMLELLRAHFNRPELKGLRVKVKHDCAQLTENGTCKIYENRPEICQEHYCPKAEEHIEMLEVDWND